MSLETGTWISDLVNTNPPGGDKKNQGDDHLRLIKTLLKNTFPNATKAFWFPTSATVSTSMSVVANDQNKRIAISTVSGAVTVTLPTLSAGDNGWEVTLIKATTDVNPVFVVPPSGNLQSGQLSLTKTRRGIPFIPFRCMWIEGTWIVERCVRDPVGTVLDNMGATLPVGFEWCSGSALSGGATNYPDVNAMVGGTTTPDYRSRSGIGRDDLGGSAAGRTGAVINALTLFNAAGTETFILLRGHLDSGVIAATGLTVGISDPTHSHGITDPGHTHTSPNNNVINNSAGGLTIGAGNPYGVVAVTTNSSTTGITVNAAATGITASIGGQINSLGGSNVAHSNLPPSIVCNKIYVVE